MSPNIMTCHEKYDEVSPNVIKYLKFNWGLQPSNYVSGCFRMLQACGFSVAHGCLWHAAWLLVLVVLVWVLVLGPSLCSNSSNSISFTRVHSESPPRRVATVEDESSEVSPISPRNHHATVKLSKGCERMRNPVRCAKQQLKTAYRQL